MSLAGDSVLVTPGSGATIATETINSKEHQVVMIAGASGHLRRTTPTYLISTGNQVNVAAARTTHFDLFNASGSGKIIRIWGIFIIPTLVAVTGVGLTWELIITNTVGSGGSTLTINKMDSDNTSAAAQITSRGKPTGGAGTSITLYPINSSSEETSPYAALASQLNHVPAIGNAELQPIILREGQGIKIDQTTNSSVGSTNIMIVLTIE